MQSMSAGGARRGWPQTGLHRAIFEGTQRKKSPLFPGQPPTLSVGGPRNDDQLADEQPSLTPPLSSTTASVPRSSDATLAPQAPLSYELHSRQPSGDSASKDCRDPEESFLSRLELNERKLRSYVSELNRNQRVFLEGLTRGHTRLQQDINELLRLQSNRASWPLQNSGRCDTVREKACSDEESENSFLFPHILKPGQQITPKTSEYSEGIAAVSAGTAESVKAEALVPATTVLPALSQRRVLEQDVAIQVDGILNHTEDKFCAPSGDCAPMPNPDEALDSAIAASLDKVVGRLEAVTQHLEDEFHGFVNSLTATPQVASSEVHTPPFIHVPVTEQVDFAGELEVSGHIKHGSNPWGRSCVPALSESMDGSQGYNTSNLKPFNGSSSSVPHHANQDSELLKLMNEMMKHMPLITKQSWLENVLALGEEPERTSWVARLLRKQTFESAVFFVIASNVIFIGVCADYAAANPKQDVNGIILFLEISFQAFYIVELAMRIFVHRIYFFIDMEERYWNLLDFGLVFFSVWDIVTTHIQDNDSMTPGSSSAFSATIFRVFRLFRLFKLFRAFRVLRSFHELRVLLRCICSSLRPLGWCMLLLTAFFYIFAIVFVNATASHLLDDNLDPSTRNGLLSQWGSVAKSMLTLYQAISGGADWKPMADPLRDAGGIYYIVFLFFIAFILLAVLNILTGIFVDSAMRVSAEDADGQVALHVDSEHATIQDFGRLFSVISGGCPSIKSSVSYEQFRDRMASHTLRARFAVMGLMIHDTRSFWNMLQAFAPNSAAAGSEEVDVNTFIAGCLQLRGEASSMNLHSLRLDLSIVARDAQATRASVASIARHLAHLRAANLGAAGGLTTRGSAKTSGSA